jgi:hypothetical protein
MGFVLISVVGDENVVCKIPGELYELVILIIYIIMVGLYYNKVKDFIY